MQLELFLFMFMIVIDNLNVQLFKKDEDNCIVYFDYMCCMGVVDIEFM